MQTMQLFCFALVVGTSTSTNPVSKVVQLLTELQAKVTHDGEVEQKQYEEFAEWCKDEATAKKYEIKDASTKGEELRAAIEKLGADVDKAVATIQELSTKISTNEKDLKSATAIRAKEAKDFAASDLELADTIDMLRRAHGIIEKSMSGQGSSEEQTDAQSTLASLLQTVVNGFVFSAQDKQQLQALVQMEQGDDEAPVLLQSGQEPKAYESKSGAILETLDNMAEEAAEMRNKAQKAEMKAAFNFQMLAQSLKNSIANDSKEMDETKKAKAGAEEAKSMAEGDLSTNEKALAEMKAAMKDLSIDCQGKAAAWDESQKSRAAELEALAKAKSIIEESTGGATQRSYEFMQMNTKTRRSGGVLEALAQLKSSVQDEALAQLYARVRAETSLDSSNDVFAKIRGMIQDMIEKLVKEAQEESAKKAYCDKEMGESEAKIEDHTDRLEDLNTRADKAAATIKKLAEMISTLEKELGQISTAQAEMDKMRQEEKDEFSRASKDLQDGVDGIQMALGVLRDYYATGDEDTALVQQAPAVGTHSASGGSASGIIGMLEVAEADFTKNLAEAKVQEETAQAEYEKVSQENQVAKATKTAQAGGATKQKASLEKRLDEIKGDKEGEQTELDAVMEYYDRLKPECVAKPESYEERKKRRENEIAGLKNALEILANDQGGSFLQRRA